MHRGAEKTAAGFLDRHVCHVERSERSRIFFVRIRNHDYWVYMLTNKHCTTLYIGITSDIRRRLHQHRCGEVDGFTKRYRLNRLVWIEHFRHVQDAITCEKKLKGWRRSRKVALIEQTNPRWLDLSDEWEQQPKFHVRPWAIEEMI